MGEDEAIGLRSVTGILERLAEALKKIDTQDIRGKIIDIEGRLDHPWSGLTEIMRGIKDIEYRLDNPCSGLGEIRRKIRDVEDNLDRRFSRPGGEVCRTAAVAGILTTGPVGRDASANSLVVVVENLADAPRTVTVTVFDRDTSANPRTVFDSADLAVEPKCARSFIFPQPPVLWEVQYSNVVAGIHVWTALRTDGPEAGLPASNYIPANTFVHKQHFATGGS